MYFITTQQKVQTPLLKNDLNFIFLFILFESGT